MECLKLKRWLNALQILLFRDTSHKIKLSKGHIGIAGEKIALRYLRNNGWRCIGKNIRFGKDELDILAVSPDEKTLAIVEVRSTLQKNKKPERTIDRRKRNAMLRVAKQLRLQAVKNKCALRVDVVTVRFGELEPIIEHFENVLPISRSRGFV
jgi:putative endonuclease